MKDDEQPISSGTLFVPIIIKFSKIFAVLLKFQIAKKTQQQKLIKARTVCFGYANQNGA